MLMIRFKIDYKMFWGSSKSSILRLLIKTSNNIIYMYVCISCHSLKIQEESNLNKASTFLGVCS